MSLMDYLIEEVIIKNENNTNNNKTLIIDRKPQKNKGRPKKVTIYEKERKELLKKLNDILGITQENNIFHLSDIDKDVNKQNQIMALESDMKLYLNCKTWNYYIYKATYRKYLFLIRVLYKEMNYIMEVFHSSHFDDGKQKQNTCYRIKKKD